jgi:hypothetical protein
MPRDAGEDQSCAHDRPHALPCRARPPAQAKINDEAIIDAVVTNPLAPGVRGQLLGVPRAFAMVVGSWADR